MKDYLKEYNVQLTVKGPLYIGCGKEIKKKEYIYDRQKKRILVPALDKMYAYLRTKHLHQEYERFLLHDRDNDLGDWMREKGINMKEAEQWLLYELDCGDAVVEKGKTLQVMQCVKDAYGNPYIPGSSLKGMLRTILLSYCIIKDDKRFECLGNEMFKEAQNRTNRKNYLAKQMKNIEIEAFHSLNVSDKKWEMVNDCLAGLIVSDSRPISVDALTLCQKIEYHMDASETRLPLLRECIKPGTVIDFTITIDVTRCPFSVEDMKAAINDFADSYYQYFSGRFPKAQRPETDTVWLGGGVGYVSKTINYPLYGKDGVRMAQTVFNNTLSGKQLKEHKHNMDTKMGVSPHILKLTIYQGKRYQFGECKLQIV